MKKKAALPLLDLVIARTLQLSTRAKALCDLDKADDAVAVLEKLQEFLSQHIDPKDLKSITQDIYSDVIAEDLKRCGETDEGIRQIAGRPALRRLKKKLAQ
jgi:hypothetical protein